MSISIGGLGVRVDGWADIVEGAASKAQDAQRALEQTLRTKQMPDVSISPTQISTHVFGGKQRPYLITEMPKGVTATIYIGPFGNDLYATWDLYARPLLNMRTILAILGAAFIMTVPCGLTGFLSGMGSLLGNRSFSSGVGGLVGSVIGSVCIVLFGTLVVAFFFTILVGIAGFALRGNPLAFFFKELDAFDADDAGAMTLAVHKSVLHALDQTGINTQALRLKEQFRAGSRERLI